MPKRYRSVSKKRRRHGPYRAPVKRRRTRAKMGPTRSLGPLGGFPKTKRVRMRYYDEISIDTSAGLQNYATFLANGVYDPDTGLGGHQPMGFDQWMTHYTHFTVIGSKISVKHLPEGIATGPTGLLVVTMADQAATGSMTKGQLMESHLTGANKQLIGLSAGSLPYRTPVVKKFSAKKAYKANPMSLDRYWGGISADPTDRWYYNVHVLNVGGNDPAPMNISVTIDYIVVFHGTRLLPQS